LISATNADLDKLVAIGQFREDLRFRINTITIQIPSLATRRDDIEDIAHHYLEIYKRKYQKPELQLDINALSALKKYHWPGNIRELQHTIERVAILADKNKIMAEDLLLKESFIDKKVKPTNIEDWEQNAIIQAVDLHKGNLSKAAASLQMGRTTLYRKIKKYNIDL